MNVKPLGIHNRIRSACVELEAALSDFEDDTEAKNRAHAEAEKLRQIRRTLEEIKKQLETLND